MSVSYYSIEGVGVNLLKVAPFFVKEKVLCLIPDYDSNVSVAEVCNDLAEAVTSGGNSDLLLTYDTDSEGNVWVFYPPSMPWQRTENDPKSADEAIARVVFVVRQLTDLDTKAIEALIDDKLLVAGEK